MYISKQKHIGLDDFGTIPLGKCCNLALETIFCGLNKTKLIFHQHKETFLFPFQLPNEKYRAIIADKRHNTITYYTTEHNMSQTERNQAHKIMKALDKNIQTQQLTWTKEDSTYEMEVAIYKLKHSYKKIGSLTNHNNNDTGFILYHFIQQFILNKTVYLTLDLHLICKQVAIQLTLDKYTEFVFIYATIEN